MTSQTIDRYEVHEQLGRGGMATVYHAYDPNFGRDVAIKVLPREFLHDPTFRARFEREVKAIATLEHSAIVPVHDFGEHEGQPYLVMRYMPGGSLAKRIKAGPLSLDEAVTTLERVGAALDSAHRQGVVHRDVKPGNILFDRHGDAYLSDFGIAKLSEATAQLTGSGIIGTPAYMAPEMAGPGGVSPLIDVYALGVTLYEMLAGKLPFDADTPLGLLMAHVTAPVPDVRLERPDLPDAVQAVIERAMVKDPTERYQSAGDLAADLRAAVAAPAAVTVPAAPGEFAPETMPAPPLPPGLPPETEAVPARPAPARRRGIPGWVWAVGGLGALIVVGLVVGVLALGPLVGNVFGTPEPGGEAARGEKPTPEPTSIPAAMPTNTMLEAAEPVTIEWWHIQSDPGPHQDAWQKMADTYMAEHPDVTINITILENEAFKSKLTTVMQAGEPPDLFQSWGGGVMNEYAKAGLLKDITAEVEGEWGDSFGAGALGVYAYDGVQYGVPWDMGAVGFWYNKDLFDQAGIDAPPETWSEFLDAVESLENEGIIPIALGEGEKWPGHFYWVYLATRLGGKAAFDAAYSREGAFTDAPYVEAGVILQELIALEPFQEGFMAASHNDSEALLGDGEAAMLLMGQWAPEVSRVNSSSGEGLGEALGFFAFPAVEGGAGALTDVMGGGNGIVVGRDAPAEAVDFLRFLTNLENQSTLAGLGVIIPVVKGAEKALADPNMLLVFEVVSAADYFQLYYDQYLPPAVGEAVNDSVQELFGGSMIPEEATQAIDDAYARELGE